MSKYPIYFIVALVFLGIAKLIQVTAFDAEQYAENKEASFSNSIEEEESNLSAKNKTELDSDLQQELSSAQDTIKEPEEVPSEDFSNNDLSDDEPSEKESSPNSLADLKNNYLAPKIAGLPSGQLREDVVLRYYKHEKDGDRVYSLRKLGYYIHEKEATETTGLGSNILYYGDEVNVEDIQIVALMLLDKGLPIKAIQRSQFDWKSNSIEIGTDTLLLEAKNLQNKDVLAFEK